MKITEFLQKINNETDLIKIKQLIRQYYYDSQYSAFQTKVRQEYEKEFPLMDRKGKLITYSDQKYKTDDEGNILKDNNDEPILNENYKPTFEEWLFDKSQQWTTNNVEQDFNDNPYVFKFNEKSIISEQLTLVKNSLKPYIRRHYLEIKPKQGLLSNTIGVKINCTRVDLNNMKNLLEDMEDEGVESTQFRVYDDSFIEVTQDDLRNMIKEVRQYGKQLYALKWQIESNINNATTLNELLTVLDNIQ